MQHIKARGASRVLWALAALLLMLLPAPALAEQSASDAPVIWFFWGDGCPYCAQEQEFLAELKERYPEVKILSYEIWYNPANRVLMQRLAAERGKAPQSVPVTIIDEHVWIGFNKTIANAIEAAVLQDDATKESPVSGDSTGSGEQEAYVLEMPFVGAIDLTGYGLVLSTLLIAFVDGLNPCSLWVLSLLLALVIRSRSRRKTLWVGITFLTVTALVYGAFMVGLFSLFSTIEMTLWVRVIVASIALVAAAINIKDFFAFRKGVSLTISDRYKPGIYERMRSILHAESAVKSIVLTVILAAGVSLIELPCTAGLPILWTNMVAAEEVGTAAFAALLALYLLVFVVDELVLFIAALITLKVTKLGERHGRGLKLVGGVLMLYLGLALLLKPQLMNSVAGASLVFALAGVTILVIWVVWKGAFATSRRR